MALAIGLAALAAMPISASSADDPKVAAAHLSDGAFALLNSLNSAPRDAPNPLLGPVATFASDTQILSTAINAGDHAGAARAAAALSSDCDSIDSALKSNPGALKSAGWESLKSQLASIQKQIGPPPANAASSAPSAPRSPSAPAGSGPRIRIDSYTVEGDSVHVKGFFEGRALVSAGVYESGQQIKALAFRKTSGAERVDFDLKFDQINAGTAIVVQDAARRRAEAPVASEVAIEPAARPPEEAETKPLDELAPSDEESGENTAEIEPHLLASPSHRHLSHARPRTSGDLRISIATVTPLDPLTGTYEVIGQVSGHDIQSAGIYVDGSLVQDLDAGGSAGFTASSFDETFTMSGRQASIRLYGAHGQFAETPIGLGIVSSPALAYGSGPGVFYGANPNPISIQIGWVRQVAPNAIVVTGVISGANLGSAGLYQNGILVQQIPLAGGLVSMLAPDALRSVNFTVQFNPAVGFASIRAFDRTGAYTEQPINAGYGYAASPFGPRPSYGTSPYGYRYPYAAPTPVPRRNWLNNLLR